MYEFVGHSKKMFFDRIHKFLSPETEALARKLHLELVRKLSELHHQLQRPVSRFRTAYSIILKPHPEWAKHDEALFLALAV